jgi:hypothetical protein
MDSQIRLFVAFEVELIDTNPAVDRLLEDRGCNKAFFRCPDDLGHADTDLYDFHIHNSEILCSDSQTGSDLASLREHLL